MTLEPNRKNDVRHKLMPSLATVKHGSNVILKGLKEIEAAIEGCAPSVLGVRIDSSSVIASVFRVGWHPKLIEVVSWLYDHHPKRIVLTCGHRESRWMNRPDIHNTDLLRAFDLRSREFANPTVTETWINQNWDYGKKPYRVCKFHLSARCSKCSNVFCIDTRKGLLILQTCPKCKADHGSLIDLGPHFHLQVRNETRFVGE